MAICHEQLLGSQNTLPQHSLQLLQTEWWVHRRSNQSPVTGLSILVTCAVFKSLRRDLQTARQVSKQQGHCTPHRSHRQGPWIGLRCEATPGSVLLSPGWVPLGTGLIRSQVQRLFGPACERDCILPIFQKEKKLRMLRGITSLAQVTQ